MYEVCASCASMPRAWSAWRRTCIKVISSAFEHSYTHVCAYQCMCVFRLRRKFKMSAEPGRKAPYSNDIRWCVVWQRIGIEPITNNLCISLGTVHNHFKRFQETGDVSKYLSQNGKLHY